jgi:methyltransferase (TIGR00027 family)
MAERTEIASSGGPLIRNISDTALWVAVYRARETERPDALFRDPLARKLAGERGEQIARSMQFGDRHSWSYVARTWLVDQMISKLVQQGTDMVVNLAAGLDTRPYRMDLPRPLRWIEVDLPPMIDYKEQVLSGEKPVCELTRVRLDLSSVDARRALFADLGGKAKRALVISEGLVVYLTRDEVGMLARDLAAPAAFQYWVLDLISPGLLKMLQQNLGAPLTAAGSPLKFAPEEGPDFFLPYGWRPAQVETLLKTAGRLKRLSLGMRLVSLLPQSNGRQGSRPWGAMCLFAKQ